MEFEVGDKVLFIDRKYAEHTDSNFVFGAIYTIENIERGNSRPKGHTIIYLKELRPGAYAKRFLNLKNLSKLERAMYGV